MNGQLPRSSLYSCAVVSCKAERTKSRGLVSPFHLHVLWRYQAAPSPYDAVYQAIIKKKEMTPNLLAYKSRICIGNQRYNGARCRKKLKTKVCFQKVDEWEHSNLIQKYCLQLNKQCIFSLECNILGNPACLSYAWNCFDSLCRGASENTLLGWG